MPVSKRVMTNLRNNPVRQIQRNNDGWGNLLTGAGIAGRDKSVSTKYNADIRLEYYELTQIYRGDGIGRRIIDVPTGDMYRQWIALEGDTDNVINKALSKLNAKKSLKRAQRFGYLYGGALAIMGIDDGGYYEDPVNEKRIKAVTHLHVFDRWRVTLNTADLYIDPNLDKYGKPEYYMIVPIYGSPFRVHESRVLRFEGNDVADQHRIQNQGWGDSVLQCVYNRLAGLGESYCNLQNILAEFIIGVLTIDNLQELIANGQEALIQKRLTQIDLSKHIINSVLVDKEESFTRVTSTVGGLGELMDKLIEAVSGVTGIPIPLLMGRSMAGLSNDEQSLLRFYYDKVSSQQEEDMLPQLNQLLRYVNIAEGNPLGDEWEVKFNPLWQPTLKQTIDTRNVQATIDKIYLDSGVLLPEEVALARFGGDHYSHETVLSEEHLNDLEEFKQTPPSDEESEIADDYQKKQMPALKKDERLGVMSTTDLKNMVNGPARTNRKVPGKRQDGGTGSGNFDHNGRPGEQGGSGHGNSGASTLIKSHATPIKNIESIKKNGIVRPANLLRSDPEYPVYFADTEDAVHAAGKYWGLENGKAAQYAVVRFKIPKGEKVLPHTRHEHAFEIHRDIPPEWITAIDIYDKDGKYKGSRNDGIDSGDKLFYAFVPIDNTRQDGGEGSGNFNHGGLPGQRGGSTRAMDKKSNDRRTFEGVHSIAQKFHDISERIMSFIDKGTLTAEDRDQLSKLHEEHKAVKEQFSSLGLA